MQALLRAGRLVSVKHQRATRYFHTQQEADTWKMGKENIKPAPVTIATKGPFKKDAKTTGHETAKITIIPHAPGRYEPTGHFDKPFTSEWKQLRRA